MKEYYNLPVYHASIEFLKQVDIHTNKIPKEERYLFVHPIKKSILDIMKYIAKSNSNSTETKYLEISMGIIKDIQIDIRGWFELKIITYKGFSILSDRSEKILRQLNGWDKSRNNTNKININQNPS